jgi:hypothetical protein
MPPRHSDKYRLHGSDLQQARERKSAMQCPSTENVGMGSGDASALLVDAYVSKHHTSQRLRAK